MKWLDHLEEWLIASFMGAATLIIFVSVLHRYLVGFQSPMQDWLLTLDFAWAQEATIYLFVWMAKFGAAYGVRTGIHVGVDVLINQLSPPKRKVFVLFGLLAGALFTGTIATMGANFVWHNGADYAFRHALPHQLIAHKLHHGVMLLQHKSHPAIPRAEVDHPVAGLGIELVQDLAKLAVGREKNRGPLVRPVLLPILHRGKARFGFRHG